MGRIGEAKSDKMEEATHIKQAPLGRQALGLQEHWTRRQSSRPSEGRSHPSQRRNWGKESAGGISKVTAAVRTVSVPQNSCEKPILPGRHHWEGRRPVGSEAWFSGSWGCSLKGTVGPWPLPSLCLWPWGVFTFPTTCSRRDTPSGLHLPGTEMPVSQSKRFLVISWSFYIFAVAADKQSLMPDCDPSILHNSEQWGAASESEELAVSQSRHPFPLRRLSPSTANPPGAKPPYVHGMVRTIGQF